MHTIRTRTRMRTPTRTTVAAAVAVLSSGLLLATAAPTQATFPGDNGLLAFVSDRDGQRDEIYVMNSDGTNQTRLTSSPAGTANRGPAMSPNGREIVFSSTRNDAANPNPTRDTELYVMDAVDDDGDGNGDNLRRLTDDTFSEVNVAWSPDRRKIVFRSNRDGSDELYLMDPDAGTEPPVQLTNTAAPVSNQLPDFSPDGSTVVFTRVLSNVPPIAHLFAIDADGDNLRDLTPGLQVAQMSSFSPDGTKIAFSSFVPGLTDLDIWVMVLDEDPVTPGDQPGAPTNITDALTTNERWPTWSPDGFQIAFWSGAGNGAGGDAEIRVVNADGSGPITNLSNTPGADLEPDWGRQRVKPRG